VLLWLLSQTAYDYDDEKDIAKGIAAAGAKASDLFLTTKIPCASYSKAAADIKSNLADLGVGEVDLTLIHFPRCSGGQSVAETWRALEDAKAAGLTKAIGVSHFGASDFEALAKTQKEPPVLNQCQLSVGKHDDATIAYCRQHGIVYQSYSPLCGGANGSSCSMGGGSSVLEIAQVVDIAQAHKVSPAQVGLKWVAQQGFPIACASWKQDFMVEDLDLWSWGNLTAAEMATLAAVTHP